jgi:hypothetical protein
VVDVSIGNGVYIRCKGLAKCWIFDPTSTVSWPKNTTRSMRIETPKPIGPYFVGGLLIDFQKHVVCIFCDAKIVVEKWEAGKYP